jgi:predicted MPP superfamily phosphohydrolase
MSSVDIAAAACPGRRRRTLFATGAAGLAVAAFYAFLLEPRRIVVEHRTIALPNLLAELTGFTLLQLSDFHAGNRRGWEARLRRVVRTANDLRPDLIALTGDFVNRTAVIPACMAVLAELRATHGTIAVFGNHDYAGSPRRTSCLAAALADVGITLLRNDVYVVPTRASLVVVGLDDACTGHDKPAVALSRLPRVRGTRIMLSHYPDAMEALSPRTVDLVLSGHTHGGQIGVPLLGRLAGSLRARTAYLAGLYDVDGTVLYVNRGIGTSFPGARFLAPPELTCITLEPAT